MKIGKFKKLAAIGLALTMAIGLLYTNGTVNAVDSKTDNGIVLNKTAEYDSETDQVKITLESYATGKVVSGERTPSDIVLLLDVSGSMDKPFGDSTKQYIEKEFGKYTSIEDLEPYWGGNKTNYYYQVGGEYYEVYIESYREDPWPYITKYQLYYKNGNNKIYILKDWVNEDKKIKDLNITLYEYKEVQSKKIDALKNAANTFIDGIAEQNANITDSSLKDRISIVKFAGKKSNDVGDDTYIDGFYTYNYTQIVKNLTNISDSQDLKDVVNQLEAAGATSADYGLERAQTALGSKQEGRNQVVIMFTDGEPNHDSGFSNTVAKDAIDTASDMKDTGVTIYTVGVFEKADPSDTESDFNKYMHAVSSNYLDITYINDWENFYYMDLGIRNPDGKDYYLTAKNPDDLINAFEQILDDVGESSSDLTDDAVVIDYIEDSFNLPTNTSQIQVSTVDYINGKFEDNIKEELPNADVSIDEHNKAIKVKGFNYSDYYVLKDNPDGDHVGKKLVIEFYVTPKDGFIGGNNVETNKVFSGIYQNSDSQEPIEEFVNPKVDIPLDYAIENYDATIYRGNDWNDFVHFITNDSDEIVYKNKRHNKNESTTFELNGVRNEYVDITYTIKDSNNEVVAKLSIPAGKTIDDYKSEILNKFTAKNLKDCTDFQVDVKVEPKDDKNDGVESIETTSHLKSTLHVLKPNIHVNDSTIDFGTQTNLMEENVSYNSNLEWVDVKSHSNIPDVEGPKPVLSLSIEKVDSSTQKLENDIYTPMEAKDANFKLDVTKNDDSSISYNDCVINDNEQTNQFTVHIRTATLDIAKVLDPNDYESKDGEPIFIYKVTVSNEHLGEKVYYRYIHLGKDIESNNDLSVLNNLPVGSYKVEELNTLRFKLKNVEVIIGNTNSAEKIEKGISFNIISLINNKDFVVEFTNTIKSKDYDSDNDIIVNTFKKGSNGEVIMNQRLNNNNNN